MKYPTDHVRPSRPKKKRPKVRKVYGPSGEVLWLNQQNQKVNSVNEE